MNAILKSKLNILIHLAAVDGDFDPSERAFIYNICLRHGVDLDLIGYLIDDPEPIGDLDSISYDTSKDYLIEAILLMLVDGKVLPSEVLFCLDMGERLGFKRQSVEKLIEKIQDDLSISYENLEKLVSKLEYKS